MIKLFLYLSIFIQIAFSYNSVDIQSDSIELKNVSFYKSDNSIVKDAIFKKYKNKEFENIPEKGFSLGYSKAIYWFAFEFKKLREVDTFLKFRRILTEKVNLYLYQNEKLTEEIENGYLTQIEDRDVEKESIVFKLKKDEIENRVFLLRVESRLPILISFLISDSEEIDSEYQNERIFLAFFSGIIFSLFVYYLIIYIYVKDNIYLFYNIYLLGSTLLILFLNGCFISLTQEYLEFTPLFIVFMAQIKLIGLVLFTNNFLNIRIWSERLFKFNIYLLIVACIFLFLIPYSSSISIFAPIAIYITFIYYGFKKLKANFKPAIFYLLATGVALISYIVYMLMCDIGIFIDYSFYTFHLPNFGLIWDVLFLSISLSYKIKLLKKEKENSEKLLFLRSNIESIGQMSANIAHQWRTPLGEIGSINSNILARLKYGLITKVELENSLELNEKILNQLSSTIDTFEDFYKINSRGSLIDLEKSILKIGEFFETSLKEINIELKLNLLKNIYLKISYPEFSQIVLILLVNSKEAFEDKSIKSNKYIQIDMKRDKEIISITLSDNARGVDIEPIETIFKPHITSKPKGTGLGLYIAKVIAEKNQLNLSVENIENGVKFKIKFKCID